MTKRKFLEKCSYSSPECLCLEVIVEGTILSASTETTVTSPEGYDVDNEFNW